MATSQTLGPLEKFPAGTSVAAYKRSNWGFAELPPIGSPKGSSDATGTIGTNGTVVLSGLTSNTDYFLYGSVSGQDRYAGFTSRDPTGPLPGGPAGGDLSGNFPNPDIGSGVIVNADVNASAAIAESKLNLASDAAAGTASRRTLGTGAAQAAAGNDSRLSDARTPTAHATSHQPGGSDAMAVDAAAATGSLRTLGTGASQAAPGNDARLSDARVPTAHATSHQPGGSDAMAVDAAAATGSLRTLGKSATQAASGADTEYAFSTYKVLLQKPALIGAGVAASTFLLQTNAVVALAASSSGVTAFYLDPADYAAGGRTTKLRVKAAVLTNAVAPGVNFTFHLYPVATFGGASGANPTVATVGASLGNVAINVPGASSQSTAVTSDFNFPSAGWHVLAVVNSGTTAASSAQYVIAELQLRQV